MKKIIALILVLSLTAFCFVACKKDKTEDTAPTTPTTPTPQTPAEKTYTLSLAVDEGFSTVSRGGVTAIALAIVTDADGKIVAARLDSVQPKFALNADKNDVVEVSRVDTKVELGDAYTGMSDSWKDEAAAFEAFLVGKTAAEVAALEFVVDGEDAGLVAGCTMIQSMPAFKALVAEAFAYTRKVTFKTSETVTLGLAIDAKVAKANIKVDGVTVPGGKISADFAAVAIAGGKVVAAMIDSAEGEYTLSISEGKLTVGLNKYAGTKNEQGDAYDAYSPMGSGRWYAQAQYFANTAVGKTVADLANLSTEAVEGSCSIYTGGYKAVIVRAAGYAR